MLVIGALIVEFLKKRGELPRAIDISSEDEDNNYSDEVNRIYRKTFLFLGLDWPPPAIDEVEDGGTP